MFSKKDGGNEGKVPFWLHSLKQFLCQVSGRQRCIVYHVYFYE